MVTPYKTKFYVKVVLVSNLSMYLTPFIDFIQGFEIAVLKISLLVAIYKTKDLVFKLLSRSKVLIDVGL